MRFVFVSEEPGWVQLVVHALYEGARVRKYCDGIDDLNLLWARL